MGLISAAEDVTWVEMAVTATFDMAGGEISHRTQVNPEIILDIKPEHAYHVATLIGVTRGGPIWISGGRRMEVDMGMWAGHTPRGGMKGCWATAAVLHSRRGVGDPLSIALQARSLTYYWAMMGEDRARFQLSCAFRDGLLRAKEVYRVSRAIQEGGSPYRESDSLSTGLFRPVERTEEFPEEAWS